jgi:hypothetical protein
MIYGKKLRAKALGQQVGLGRGSALAGWTRKMAFSG